MIIKGRGNNTPCDEGFVSFYDSTPASVFPQVLPAGVGNGGAPRLGAAEDPDAQDSRRPATRRAEELLPKLGNRAAYESAVEDETAGVADAARSTRRWRSCERRSSSASRASARRAATLRTPAASTSAGRIHGEAGKDPQASFGAVPLGSREQQRRALGFATKLQQVAQDIAATAAREDARDHPPPQRVGSSGSGCCSRSSAPRASAATRRATSTSATRLSASWRG